MSIVDRKLIDIAITKYIAENKWRKLAILLKTIDIRCYRSENICMRRNSDGTLQTCRIVHHPVFGLMVALLELFPEN